MEAVDVPIFDADNHYYEALDAFTRHLDPALGRRVIQWVEIDGRRYHAIGGRVNHAVVNPTFDPVAPPGVLADYFRGNPKGDDPLQLLKARERIRPEYRDRDARLAVMDGQGLDAVWLFPTLGMIYEEPLRHDPEAVTFLFTAFNRWLEEDWGFAYRDRIFAAPYLTLADVGWACRELEWALDRGARTVVMRPAAPTTVAGPRPPTDPQFDPFWARVQEAGITVVVHAGDSGYTSHGYARDGFSTDFGGIPQPIRMLQLERPIEDFLASLVADKLFERFPHLRIASVENGSRFLPGLLDRFEILSRKMAGWFGEDPAETFRRHVWVNPFWEDDLHVLLDTVGADRVIFGSDWPHIEALPEPLDYTKELVGLDDADCRRILHDNAAELNQLRPA
jgi:predicted TIM-barrel fold metal-dependent hydrolase